MNIRMVSQGRIAAMLAALALFGAACASGGDGDPEAEGTPEAEEPTEANEPSDDDASEAAESPVVVPVGVSSPLTGDYAAVGDWFLQGVELAAMLYEPESNLQLEVIAEDNQVDPTQAVSVFNKLVDENDVPVIFGGFTSLSVAVAPIAARTETVYINPLAPADELRGQPYVFNTLPLTSQEMAVLASWIESQEDVQRVGLVTSTQHDGVSAGETLTEQLEDRGIEVVEWQRHEGGATDFSANVARIRDADADLIHVHDPFLDFSRVVRALREAGVDQQITGYRGVESPDLLENCGDACEGVVFTAPFYDVSTPEAQDVLAAYQDEYGEEGGFYFGVMYDAAWVVFQAIDALVAAGTEVTGAALSDALVNTAYEAPFTGTTTLLPDGVPEGKPFYIKTVEDGAFEIVDTYSDE